MYTTLCVSLANNVEDLAFGAKTVKAGKPYRAKDKTTWENPGGTTPKAYVTLGSGSCERSLAKKGLRNHQI